jgi:pyridinium-3,5-bisthiocarboxylic acid mononucleotide nickel chelatase
MRAAYLDLTSGIAGDMLLASLIDAGCDLADLLGLLRRLPLAAEFELEVRRVQRGALMGTHVQVHTAQTAADHGDHNHGDHNHGYQDHGEHDHGRTYTSIVKMIRESGLPARVVDDATAVFRLIGEVEARLHGSTIDEIHFHEVGAVDSIVDIVGVCAALHLLGVEAVYSSPVTDGTGTLVCAHGVLPVPAPASLELLKGMPLVSVDIPFELVTPTGAGLLRHFCKGFGPRPPMIVEQIGYGAGTRDLAQRPNLLRVSVGTLLAGEPPPSGTDQGSTHAHGRDQVHEHVHGHARSEAKPGPR